MQANEPPSIEEVRKVLFPLDKFHLFVVGTEECENSIMTSFFLSGKNNWMAYLTEAFGPNYVKITACTMQATHIVMFAHVSIHRLISDVGWAAVPTGIANVVGNKGGVSIVFTVGKTKFIVTNAHLTAHQDKVDGRNADFKRINEETPKALSHQTYFRKLDGYKEKRSQKINRRGGDGGPQPRLNDVGAAISNDSGLMNKDDPKGAAASRPSGLIGCADRVIFMGDLNYRIRGTRWACVHLPLKAFDTFALLY